MIRVVNVHEGRLIHWARIATDTPTGDADPYGVQTSVTTYASTKCIFINGGGGKVLESGKFVLDLPKAILPASTIISEGMRLIGVSAGWTREYVVAKVRAVWNRRGIDHISVDLETA